MDNDKSNITVGKPKPGGALYWAPAGTTLPTDASTPLASEYVNLGYVSEDGITISTEEEVSELIAWGPETVAQSQEKYTKKATFNLLETSRVAVLQFRYGKDNVVVGNEGQITVHDTGAQTPRGVFVVETLQNNGAKPRIHRQVLGDAQFTDRSGDMVYNNSDAVTVPVVLNAYKFKQSGVTSDAGDYILSFWTKPGP